MPFASALRVRTRDCSRVGVGEISSGSPPASVAVTEIAASGHVSGNATIIPNSSEPGLANPWAGRNMATGTPNNQFSFLARWF